MGLARVSPGKDKQSGCQRPQRSSQSPYLDPLHSAHGRSPKATTSQRARPLPKRHSANGWGSYQLLLNEEEEPDRHHARSPGPFGTVCRWAQTSSLWGRRGLAETG